MICITTANKVYSADWIFYKIANRGVASKVDFKALNSFKDVYGDKFETYDIPVWEEYELLNDANSTLKYHGKASFENVDQEVHVWHQDNLLQIDVSDKPVCQLNISTRQILIVRDNHDDDDLIMEVVLGPALIMLLSDQGIYCIHSGAVKMASGNAFFMSESGNGKSTLTAGDGPDWIQIADDILPITLYKSRHVALPCFPQLKVKGLNLVASKNSPLPINIIYRISGEKVDEIKFKKLDGVQALLEVIRHTVSAKLFDKRQLAKHLVFSNELLKHTPIYEISYPRDLNQLSHLRQEIIKHTESVLQG